MLRNGSSRKGRARIPLLEGMGGRAAAKGQAQIWPETRRRPGGGGRGSTDRDGEEPPGHLHHGRVAEVAGEERDVDGG